MVLVLKIKDKEIPTIINGHNIVEFDQDALGDNMVKVQSTDNSITRVFKDVIEIEVYNCTRLIKKYKLGLSEADLIPPPDYPEPPVSTKDSSMTQILEDGKVVGYRDNTGEHVFTNRTAILPDFSNFKLFRWIGRK